MSFRNKINTMALKLAQSTMSYFMIHYSRDIKVFEFPAYFKTLVLGAEQEEKKLKSGKISYKTMGDKERKKWSIQEGFNILALREDFETMAEVGIMKKKDDIFDTIIQLQAFKFLYFIEKMTSF